jgi:hypothetical protein
MRYMAADHFSAEPAGETASVSKLMGLAINEVGLNG